MLNCYYDDENWVIAGSPEEAFSIWGNEIGESLEDYENYFVVLDQSRLLKIYDEIEDKTTEKTIAEWINLKGKGFLCTRNF